MKINKDKKTLNGFGITTTKEVLFLDSSLKKGRKSKEKSNSPEVRARSLTTYFRKAIRRMGFRDDDFTRVELLLAEEAEKVKYFRKDWHHPEAILLALVELCKSNDVTATDVIKFEVTGEMSPSVFSKLESYLEEGYVMVGARVSGKAHSRHRLIRIGKREVANPRYYRFWKFLKKKRSLKFWKKKN